MQIPKRRLASFLVVVPTAAWLAAACGGDDGTSTAARSDSPKSTQSSDGGKRTVAGVSANDHGTRDVTGLNELELEADDFYFAPTVLQGTPGQRLTLEIHNEGAEEHNFTVEDQKLDEDIAAGDDVTVTVTFPASGIVSFVCEYHVAGGMAGGLATGQTQGGTGGDSGTPDAPDGYRNY